MTEEDQYSRHTYSYLALRRFVGFIGVSLPIVLIIGMALFFEGPVIQESISHYYYTGMGDVFVGLVCFVALFLFFYSGHDVWENIVTTVTGGFALGIAWLPTTKEGDLTTVGLLHLICATFFFLLLAYISLRLFSYKSPPVTSIQKALNKIYITCGTVIIVCVVLIFIFKLVIKHDSIYVFILESIALVFFGISWLTKGRANLMFRIQTPQ
jgi:hypothetical protein